MYPSKLPAAPWPTTIARQCGRGTRAKWLRGRARLTAVETGLKSASTLTWPRTRARCPPCLRRIRWAILHLTLAVELTGVSSAVPVVPVDLGRGRRREVVPAFHDSAQLDFEVCIGSVTVASLAAAASQRGEESRVRLRPMSPRLSLNRSQQQRCGRCLLG